MLNNFFPALESGQADQMGNSVISQDEQYTAQQQLLLQGENPEQVINEAPPEEEEGESQDIMNSRIQQTSVQAQVREAMQQQ